MQWKKYETLFKAQSIYIFDKNTKQKFSIYVLTLDGNLPKVYLEEFVLFSLIFFLFSFIVKDRETFFSSAQRSQIVWQILMRSSYDDDEDDKVGIR